MALEIRGFNGAQIREQLRGIEHLIQTDEVETLHTLLGKLKELSQLGKMAKSLATKIQIAVEKPFLNADILDKVLEKLDLISLIRFSEMNHYYRDFVLSQPKYFWKILFYRALHDALELVPKIERDVLLRNNCLEPIISGICNTDPIRALELTKGFADDNTLCFLLKAIARLEPLKVLPEVDERLSGFDSYRVYSEIVRHHAQNDVEGALAFAYSFTEGQRDGIEIRAILLGVISATIFKEDPIRAKSILDEAVALSLQLGDNKDCVLYAIAKELIMIPEWALYVIDLVPVAQRDIIYHYIVINLLKSNLPEAMRITRQMNNNSQVVKEIAKVDVELARQFIQQKLDGDDRRDIFLCDAVPIMVLYDFEGARQFLNRIGHDALKRSALCEMCENLAPIDPDKAFEICKEAQNDEALLHVAKGYLHRDLPKALEIFEKIKTIENNEVLYSDFLIELADIDFDRALKIARRTKKLGLRAEVIIRMATIVHSQELGVEGLEFARRAREPSYYRGILALIGKAYGRKMVNYRI